VFTFSAESPLSVLDLVALIKKTTKSSLEPIIRAEATHEIADQYLSAAKARRVLAWKPAYTVEEALTETVDWYREYLRLQSGV